MNIKIYNFEDIYANINIDFDNSILTVKDGPNRNIAFIDKIFIYPERGYLFNFETVTTFLKNRGITSESKNGIYENVDDNIKIIVS